MTNETLMSLMRYNQMRFDCIEIELLNIQILILSMELVRQKEKEHPNEERIKHLESSIEILHKQLKMEGINIDE